MKTFYKIENNQLQVGQGTVIPDGFIEYTVGQEPDDLKEALANEKQSNELQQKIAEAKAYLSSTDYKMTVDYFATMTIEQQEEITRRRAESREFVRSNEQS